MRSSDTIKPVRMAFGTNESWMSQWSQFRVRPMAHRKQLYLNSLLNHPRIARNYIESFDFGGVERPKFVILGADKQVWFSDMTDAEAVEVAFFLLEQIDIPNSRRLREMLGLQS